VKERTWIPRAVILSTQEELLARFGGIAGLRDEGLLDSALRRPVNLLAYGKPLLHDLAASYAAGIIRNHPFLDGNKRAGFMAAYIFLGANGLELTASEEDACLQTRALAAGEITEADYAAWLKASCKRPSAKSPRKHRRK
jgi:death on curing protein